MLELEPNSATHEQGTIKLQELGTPLEDELALQDFWLLVFVNCDSKSELDKEALEVEGDPKVEG